MGDRVRIIEAAAHVQHLAGQTGVVCRVRATIVNVETDSGEKQYFYREWLEKLETPEQQDAAEVAIDALELKVGDRVRILKAKRYQGFFAKVREIDGATASVMPDSPDAKFLMPVAIADLERCPSVDEVYSAPTHELEEPIATPELKVGDRVQFPEFCFGESRLATGKVKEYSPRNSTKSYLVVDAEVKLPPIEEIDESYHEVYPADGISRSTIVVNDGLLKKCTVIAPEPATPESILTKHGFIDSSEFSDPRDVGEVYRDWGIALAIPNGGIIALDIFKGAQSWGKPTENEFDYLDRDGIVNHAKSVIDEIEAAIASKSETSAHIQELSSEPPLPELCANQQASEVKRAESHQQGRTDHDLERQPSAAHNSASSDRLREDLQSQRVDSKPTTAVLMMSAAEARSCVDGIKGHIESARKLLLDLYEREGWKALGFNSWRECAVTEFGESKSQLYRELEAAKIERNISPIGEIGSIKESHLRPLAKLEPEQQREAWEEAVTTAPNGKVTAAHVQEVAEKRLPKENEPPTLEAIHSLYAQIGKVGRPGMPKKSQPNAFTVEVEGVGPPFPLFFQGRKDAWAYWQKNSQKLLEVAARYPMPLNPAARCKACQHRHLVGDGSEFECGARGSSWTCAVTRDWAVENDGCDRFKPYQQTQPLDNDVVRLGKQIYAELGADPAELEDELRGEVVDVAIAPPAAIPASAEDVPLKVLFNSQFGAIAGTVTYLRVAYERDGRTLYADVPLSDVLEWS